MPSKMPSNQRTIASSLGRFHRLTSSVGWAGQVAGLLGLGVVAAGVPAISAVPVEPQGIHSARPFSSPQDWMQRGQSLYEAGQWTEALDALQQAIQGYRSQGDRLRQAMALSNVALVYQQLGQLPKAEQSAAESIALLSAPGLANSAALTVLAQAQDVHGTMQLELGQPEQALNTWQLAEKSYSHLKDPAGVARSRVSQAQALQVLGFYRRSLALLTEVTQAISTESESVLQAVALRSLGEALQLAGDLEQSHQVLERSLAIARRVQSPQDISAALFSLGNTARAQQKPSVAVADYQAAVAIAPTKMGKLQAQINHLSLLADLKQGAAAEALNAQIQSNLAALPASQTAIYARISYAQSLLKLGNSRIASPTEIAQLFAISAQQARSLGDRRAESYTLGNLGALYEQAGQWKDAQSVTQQALALAQLMNAPDIAYRWHWQLGRLLRQQTQTEPAIAAYDAAIKELQALRGDLVAVNRDVQFSFRESVEPVYRESVELLLQSQDGKPNEQTLDKARQRIEALQLAELDDFFQEACLNGKSIPLDKLVDQDNPTAAIVYPIILQNQLQVIVKIPKQPLRHHTIHQSRAEVESVLGRLRRKIIEPDATEEVKALSRQVYGWLVEPIAADLQQHKVNTLVFVLDGALRSVPMAALYDGKHYLVENYAVALSLGLQLSAPKSLTHAKLNVLAAGLVEPPPNFQRFPPLPEITSEFKLITESGIPFQQLLNAAFTSKALEQRMNATPFNVVHLATHGQFSSQAKETFILAADGPINVTQLDSLLRSRDQNRADAIELLVLSACQTAAGDNRAALGLAGVAVRAGARSTLASLWHISDRSTALLIGEFYRELATPNVTKAEALRRAQVTLMKKYPNFSRPGYWAPYVLVGNWL